MRSGLVSRLAARTSQAVLDSISLGTGSLIKGKHSNMIPNVNLLQEPARRGGQP